MYRHLCAPRKRQGPCLRRRTGGCGLDAGIWRRRWPHGPRSSGLAESNREVLRCGRHWGRPSSRRFWRSGKPSPRGGHDVICAPRQALRCTLRRWRRARPRDWSWQQAVGRRGVRCCSQSCSWREGRHGRRGLDGSTGVWIQSQGWRRSATRQKGADWDRRIGCRKHA